METLCDSNVTLLLHALKPNHHCCHHIQ